MCLKRKSGYLLKMSQLWWISIRRQKKCISGATSHARVYLDHDEISFSRLLTCKTPHTTKYDGYLKALAKVDDIHKKLDGKYHGKFSPGQQLYAWAHLVQSGKYASLDKVPDMPFLDERTKERIAVPHLHFAHLHKLTSSVGVSPGQQVGFHTECIDQLNNDFKPKFWHGIVLSIICYE